MNRLFPIPTAVLLSILVAPAVHAQAPLETIRNHQIVSDELASAGQIGYEQIPLLADERYEVVREPGPLPTKSGTVARAFSSPNPG